MTTLNHRDHPVWRADGAELEHLPRHEDGAAEPLQVFDTPHRGSFTQVGNKRISSR
jgi:hypothetical protein